MSLSFASFLSSVPAGAPVVCFGPRRAPASVLAVAARVGRCVGRSGRFVVSGGAAGADAAFASGCASVGGGVRVFRPLPGSGVRGLFARSARALRFARARRGVAVVFLPPAAFRAFCSGARCAGGSLWSARCAVRLGLPVFVASWGPGGWRSRFVPPKQLASIDGQDETHLNPGSRVAAPQNVSAEFQCQTGTILKHGELGALIRLDNGFNVWCDPTHVARETELAAHI